MSVPYNIDHIPLVTQYNRRPGEKLKSLDYITIHSTANEKSTAKNERAWLTNVTNDRQASYHIVIDQNEAIEVLPLNEIAWHAGDGRAGTGNTRSIGIELCESGDRKKTLANGAEIVAKLLYKYRLSIDRVKQHHDWSGKNCPRILRTGDLWVNFLSDVSKKLEELKMASLKTEIAIKIPQLGNVKIQVGEQELQGIVIDGVSYAPVRQLVEALGKQVEWDAQTKTVIVK